MVEANQQNTTTISETPAQKPSTTTDDKKSIETAMAAYYAK